MSVIHRPMTELLTPVALADAAADAGELELSVVIPCLNEADTLRTCIDKAHRAMREAGIVGEVVVADNGSTDSSRQIAIDAGARLVPVARRGYGSALMAGIAAARGTYVIMGDADDSYDFLEIAKFVDKLREGPELVQGCRLPAGGGTVKPGAMPFLHRWIGNPMLTWLTRHWFNAPIHDVYCGMRGFRRSLVAELDLRCTGMEYATEMIIKASLFRRRIAEVPISLHPDGRKSHPPHLRTFRDGWRTLRFFLLYSPKWLFLQPGKLLFILGLIALAVGLWGPRLEALGDIRLGPHTALFGALAAVVGHQAILFAVFAKTFVISAGLMRPDPRLERWYRRLPLERGTLLGLGGALFGVTLLLVPLFQWISGGFGDLNYPATLPWVIAGMTLTLLGLQTTLAAWFIGVLMLPRR